MITRPSSSTLPSFWKRPDARGTRKVRPRSRRAPAMVSVSQLITAPAGAAYLSPEDPDTTATGVAVQAPVRAPVVSSMMSPAFSTCRSTSAGMRACTAPQKVCRDSTAVAVSRKYIVDTPGPPGKPDQTVRTLDISVMVSSDRGIPNGIELAALVRSLDRWSSVLDSRPPPQYPGGYSLCQVERQLILTFSHPLW